MGWFICFAQYVYWYSIETLGYTDDLNQNITVEGKKKKTKHWGHFFEASLSVRAPYCLPESYG